MKALRVLAHAFIVLLLTVLTQVGGALYFGALLVRRHAPYLARRPRMGLMLAFVGLYAVAWFPVQAMATLGGRVGLPCVEDGALRVASPLYCIAHRHYVRREMLALTRDLARAVDDRHPGTLTLALDAGFPFIEGFPLLPHLSHDDGNKLDLAFYYVGAEDGGYRRGMLRSPIGYWAFEAPGERERQPCLGAAGALRWDQDWFQPFTRDDLVLDGRRLRTALGWLARARRARRVLLEPHLADRLGADRTFVRFQGCSAARHDDHFHVELR